MFFNILFLKALPYVLTVNIKNFNFLSIGQRYTSGGTGASAPTLDDLKAKAAAAGTSLRFDPHQRKEKGE